MNKLSITKEQLKEWVSQLDSDGGCDVTDRQLEALIRQSLAAMEGEQATPMSIEQAIEEAFLSVCELHPDGKNILKEARKYIASMREPKSEPLNYFKTRDDHPGWFDNQEDPQVPDKIKNHRLNSGNDAIDYYFGYQQGWNECREAMLRGGER